MMGEFKGTPGPWCADEYMSGHDGIYIRSELRHWSIAAVHATDGCSDPSRDISELEAQANARLIAATPDLLEVVEAMARFSGRNNNHHLKEMARAAIAKALGDK